jgi:hypothetical protein
VLRGDEAPAEEIVRAQRLDHPPLVARRLEVDVELDAREPRGGEVREPLVERRRGGEVGAVVVREHEP